MLIIVDLLDPGLIPSATLEKRRIFWNTRVPVYFPINSASLLHRQAIKSPISSGPESEMLSGLRGRTVTNEAEVPPLAAAPGSWRCS